MTARAVVPLVAIPSGALVLLVLVALQVVPLTAVLLGGALTWALLALALAAYDHHQRGMARVRRHTTETD
jgi:hypothetical protein